MTEGEVKHLKQWLEKAEHDLIAAKLIIENQPIILLIACFHCQQAVEKYLKRFSFFKSRIFPSKIAHWRLRTYLLVYGIDGCNR